MVKNFLALRLGLWFLILSIFPLGVVAVFVLNNVANGFDELTLENQQRQTQLLAKLLSSSSSNDINSVFTGNYLDQNESLYLIDLAGNYVYSSGRNKIGTSINNDFNSDVVTRILTGTSNAIIDADTERVIGIAPVEGQSAILVTVNENTRSKELLSTIRQSSQIQLLGALMITAIVGGVAIWIVVGLPVRKLTRAAEQIGQGNLSVEIDPDDTVDELQVLAITFNKMTDQLQKSITDLEQKVDALAKAEESLRASEEYFRALIENAQDITTVLEIDGTIRFESPSVEHELGYKPRDLVGKNVFDHMHPDDLDRVMDLFQQGLNTNTSQRTELRFKHQDGSYRYLEVIGQNLIQNAAVQGIVVNTRDISKRKQAEVDLMEAYDTTLEGWARALELRDKETENHSRRVTELTVILAEAMDIRGEDLIHIRRGAILHDIGKMGVPDEILRKPGKLTKEEFQIIKQHPKHSWALLSRIPFLERATDIPYCHHERWDGSGYPRGLKGEEIPLAARIFSIIDVWDAVQSERPYNHAWSREKAIEYLKECSGKHFDPKCVAVFLDLVEQGKV